MEQLGIGVFTEEGGKYANLHVFEANKNIVEDLKKNGKLIKMEWMKHSYPHCWRCHKPIIFRATEQWFIAKEDDNKLREKALAEIRKVKWYPKWGEKRITSMVEINTIMKRDSNRKVGKRDTVVSPVPKLK